MTRVSQVKAAPIRVVRPAAAASAAAKPTAAPRAPQPKVRLSALEQMKADRPKFKNPDEYKNYVIKFTGYIKAAKADQEVAERALDAEKKKESDASAELSKPLNAAKKVFADTHALYQAPIDRISGQLNAAKDDLQDAIYPGRKKAAELDAEAERMAQQISGLERDISDSRSRIGQLEAVISSELTRRNRAESDKSAAESEIRRLEPQAPSQSSYDSQRARTNQAANTLADARSRLSTANTRLGTARELERAIDVLSSIDSNYDSAVASRNSLKGWLTRKQGELDAATASGDASRITAAKAAYDEELSKYNAAEQKVRSYESQMSSYGASPSTISSVISSKKSQLSQYSGAQSEYDRAASAKQSAQAAYDREKSRLDSMASVVDALASNRDKRDEAARTISTANARIASAVTQKSQLNSTIYQLQDQLDTKTRQRTSTVAEANRLRSQQNPPTHPEVVAAKARVDRLQGELADAQDTYNAKIAGPKAKVDAEQKTYNDKMAPYRAKVADAQRGVDATKKAVEEVYSEFEGLKTNIGFFKRIWWKLWYHFDVKDFWKSQDALALAMSMKQERGSVALA